MQARSSNRIKVVLSIVAALITLCMSTAFGAALPQVELKTSAGVIVVELYPEAAPKTVQNFLNYVKIGQYNGTIFHRVIDHFMIQGGGMTKGMKEKPVLATIPLEAAIALNHGLKNTTGTIAMARTQDPNSAAAQFFINVADNTFLDHQNLPDGDPVQFSQGGQTMTAPRADALMATAGYTPFGKVIKGMDVVNRIKAVATSNQGLFQNVPEHDITIVSAQMLKNK